MCKSAGCLTPRRDIALITAQKSIPNPYVGPCGGVPQLPVAHSTLKKYHTVKRWHLERLGSFMFTRKAHLPWNTACGKTAQVCQLSSQLPFPVVENSQSKVASHWHTYTPARNTPTKQLATQYHLSSSCNWMDWFSIRVLASWPAGGGRLWWRKGRLLLVHYSIVWFWSVVESINKLSYPSYQLHKWFELLLEIFVESLFRP